METLTQITQREHAAKVRAGLYEQSLARRRTLEATIKSRTEKRDFQANQIKILRSIANAANKLDDGLVLISVNQFFTGGMQLSEALKLQMERQLTLATRKLEETEKELVAAQEELPRVEARLKEFEDQPS